jgi:hypothetical protein
MAVMAVPRSDLGTEKKARDIPRPPRPGLFAEVIGWLRRLIHEFCRHGAIAGGSRCMASANPSRWVWRTLMHARPRTWPSGCKGAADRRPMPSADRQKRADMIALGVLQTPELHDFTELLEAKNWLVSALRARRAGAGGRHAFVMRAGAQSGAGGLEMS